MKRIAVHTLGCKVNQYDSEAMLELFEKEGYAPVPIDEEAEVYLVNTCTVTGTGDQKSLKLIRKIGREHPDADIIVAGCLAQREVEKVTLPGVRVILGNQRRSEVVSLLKEAREKAAVVSAVGNLKNAPFEYLCVTRHEGKTRAVMKIQEGCDRYCAYCIIPSVRGPIRSMPLVQVKAEAERLAQAGYVELVLTGIHMASYGRESGETLIDAIRAVHDTEGVMRVRLGSLEPVVVTEEFCGALKGMTKVCPQFHLSLQSGSDGVLKRMRRRYTAQEYMEDTLTITPAVGRQLAVWSADLTHDGVEETILVRETEYTGEIWMVEVLRADGTVIWAQQAGSAHVGWNGIYLYEEGGKHYLMNWVPYGNTGLFNLCYRVFSLTEEGVELELRMEEFAYGTMPEDAIMAIDVPALREFEKRVNGYLEQALLLLVYDGDRDGLKYSTPEQPLTDHWVSRADDYERMQQQIREGNGPV